MIATGGITGQSAWTVGAGLTLLVGAGGAGYAIGQLNQAQNDIDDQRERQIELRKIWEEANGPMEEAISRSISTFISDMEAADDRVEEILEVTEASSEEQSGLPMNDDDEQELLRLIGGMDDGSEDKSGPGSDEDDDDILNIIGGSGKSGSSSSSSDDPSGGDPSGGGGGGGPPKKESSSSEDDKRKPEDHKLPNWFALSFLDWLKNLLEGYKMLILAAFWGGVLVKKFVFSRNKKRDVGLLT